MRRLDSSKCRHGIGKSHNGAQTRIRDLVRKLRSVARGVASRSPKLPFILTVPTAKPPKHNNLVFGALDSIDLATDFYLVDFNELATMPKSCIAFVLSRSSLLRSGARVHASMIGAEYEGALGAMSDVQTPHGIILHRNARLCMKTHTRYGC